MRGWQGPAFRASASSFCSCFLELQLHTFRSCRDVTTPTDKMEFLLGIEGKDCVLLAASKAETRSITILNTDEEGKKIRLLNDNTLMASSGEAGDTGTAMMRPVLCEEPRLTDRDVVSSAPWPVQFADFIEANVQLDSMRNGYALSPSAVANFTRNELASSLRSRKPYHVNILLGGVDPITEKPSLSFLDYLASLSKVPYAAHGYAQWVDAVDAPLKPVLWEA